MKRKKRQKQTTFNPVYVMLEDKEQPDQFQGSAMRILLQLHLVSEPKGSQRRDWMSVQSHRLKWRTFFKSRFYGGSSWGIIRQKYCCLEWHPVLLIHLMIYLLLFLKAVPSIRFNKPQKNSFILFSTNLYYYIVLCTIYSILYYSDNPLRVVEIEKWRIKD